MRGRATCLSCPFRMKPHDYANTKFLGHSRSSRPPTGRREIAAEIRTRVRPLPLQRRGRRFEPVTAHDAKVQVTLHFQVKWSLNPQSLVPPQSHKNPTNVRRREPKSARVCAALRPRFALPEIQRIQRGEQYWSVSRPQVRILGRNRTKGVHKNGLVRDARCGLLDQMIPQTDSRALMSEG